MTPCKAGHDKLFKNFVFKFTLNYDNDYNKRSIWILYMTLLNANE